MHTLKATLPYPPTVNHYWLRTRRGVRISDGGRAYRRRVRGILAGVPTLPGRVAVAITVFPPDVPRKRDLDNLLKGLLDALEHAGVYEDDSQIDLIRIEWGGEPVPGGRVEVAVVPMAAEAAEREE